jgi:aerobic-type carbon monoxide dehydrogenase small subunit (CoxS/CutS family)
MNSTFTLTVNGHSHTVSSDPDRSLLDVLREDLQLTGAKYGCGEGQCRACTVLLNGKSVPACLTSISDAAKKSVLTIEGIGKPEKLHPVQEAFLAEGAFQCGYCTAGMIMGVVGLLEEKPDASDSDISSRMQKHLCRCCSYPRITKAIRRAIGNSPTAAYNPPEPREPGDVGRVWQAQPGLSTAPELATISISVNGGAL